MKLSLDTQYRGDVVIIYCQGRIVYRDEAQALSGLVCGILGKEKKVVLEFGDVSFLDCTGVGELVSLHVWAQSRSADLKIADASPFVRRIFDLTRVGTVLDLHSSLGDALVAFEHAEAACVNC